MFEAEKNGSGGYIFLDIILGLFIFGLGFVIVLSVTNAAALAEAQAENYLQAVNLASSAMDEMLDNLDSDSSYGETYPIVGTEEKIGKFKQKINVGWESDSILWITVEVIWNERSETRNYLLHSLFYVRS